MDIRKLNKLNDLPILWGEPCSKCETLDKGFTITEVRQSGFGVGSKYIAKCRCNNCGTINKFELSGSDLDEILKEDLEEKIVFECNEFRVKETIMDYFIEFKTDKCLTEIDAIHDYPRSQVIGVTVMKQENTAKEIKDD